MCSEVPYPQFLSQPNCGNSSESSFMYSSRVTLATIEAAAIERILESPFTTHSNSIDLENYLELMEK